MPFSEHAGYKKDKLLIFLLIAGMLLEVIHDLGILWYKRVCFLMSTGTPEVNDLLTVILLPSEIAVINIEAHAKRIKPKYQRNTDFHAKAAATESVKIVAHGDEVQSASTKQSSFGAGFLPS